MRYVDYTALVIPVPWKTNSDTFLQEMIGAATIADKKTAMDRHEGHWTGLKANMEALSHKCWFSEATGATSALTVDHFRPKKRVFIIRSKDPNYAEARTATFTDGYWWLAFDPSNFRLMGRASNSSKGNYFPLIHGSPTNSTHTDRWQDENPVILDPTIEDDCKLIHYEGIDPKPAIAENADQNKYDCARITILLLNLEKDTKLKNARKEHFPALRNYLIWGNGNWEVMKAINDVNNHAHQLANQAWGDQANALVELLRPDLPFIKMKLNNIRAMNYEWTEEFVIDVAKARLHNGTPYLRANE